MKSYTSVCLLMIVGAGGSIAAAATVPVSFTLNLLDAGQPVPVQFRAWVPDGVSQIKGLIFNLPGAGGDSRNITTNGSWQALLPGMGFGIIGVKDTLGNADFSYWGTTPEEGAANFQMIMDAVANAFNHPEISNAPAIFDGLSKGGYTSSYLASMVPDRTIGYIGDKGFGVTVAGPGFTGLSQTPGLAIAGSQDQTEPPLNVNSFYQEAREQGAEVGQAIDWNVGHSAVNPQLRYAFIDQAIRARYPTGQVPSSIPGNPLQLVNNTAPWMGQANVIDTSQGFSTADPFIPINSPQIGPYNDGNPDPNLDPNYDSLLPTQAMAMVYQAQNAGTYNTSTRPLQISVLNAINTNVSGQPIDIGLTLNGLTSDHIELYHDEDLIAVFNQSNGLQQFLYTPTQSGLQTFIAIAQYSNNGVTGYTSNYVVVGATNVPEPVSGMLVVAGVMALPAKKIGRRQTQYFGDKFAFMTFMHGDAQTL